MSNYVEYNDLLESSTDLYLHLCLIKILKCLICSFLLLFLGLKLKL